MQAIYGHRRRRVRTVVERQTPLEPDKYAMLDEIIKIYVPRDKVYAFRGLNEQWTNVVIDYKKSSLQVFLDAVQPGRFATGPESVRLAASCSLVFCDGAGHFRYFRQACTTIGHNLRQSSLVWRGEPGRARASS